MLEASGRIAALWLNVGNAHTAEGQAEKLEWMLEHGARIGSYRGEAERRFGEFVAAFEPTFRHAEMAKNEVWAQFLALVHNTLVDLRAKVDGGTELKPRPSQKPIKGEGGWSVLATTFVMARVRPSLVRLRAFALKLANATLDHSSRQWLRLAPQHLKPAWAGSLIAG
jgi:hypothetical protein